MVYLELGKLLYLLWYVYATGQIVIVVNGLRFNNIIDIWSHCSVELRFQSAAEAIAADSCGAEN